MKNDTSLLGEIEPVLRSGICVGCGACAVAAPEAISIQRNNKGSCEAVVENPEIVEKASSGVCPFGETAPNEDEHSVALFGTDCKYDPFIGRYRGLWAGHAETNGYRENGSSGGITSLVLAKALEDGLVDAVINVRARYGDDDLFEYSVARSVEDVRAGAKTRYYSVTMAAALREIRGSGDRVAVVGVPCFIKAVRNLTKVDEDLAKQIAFTISIFCGHMKSSLFAENLAWQAGVKPSEISNVDFRTKQKELHASNYALTIETRDGHKIVRSMRTMLGRRWDCGFFRLKACDYCDDVVGETADISLGDAWLTSFVEDWQGHNIIITRSAVADRIFRGLINNGNVKVEPLTPDRVVASQGGGFRDRREGLAYRLHMDERRGRWHPKKRVKADHSHLSFYRKSIYRFRGFVRDRSFSAHSFSCSINSIHTYMLEMSAWNFLLATWAQLPSHFGRLFRKLERMVR